MKQAQKVQLSEREIFGQKQDKPLIISEFQHKTQKEKKKRKKRKNYKQEPIEFNDVYVSRSRPYGDKNSKLYNFVSKKGGIKENEIYLPDSGYCMGGKENSNE